MKSYLRAVLAVILLLPTASCAYLPSLRTEPAPSQETGPVSPPETAAAAPAGTPEATEAEPAVTGPRPLFTDVTELSGIPSLKYSEGVSVMDISSDGLPELYLPDVKGPDKLYGNLGGLGFADITKPSGIDHSGGIGALFGDLDGDGKRDIFVVRGAYPYGVDVLYRGGTGPHFEDVSEESGIARKKNGISAALADCDLDGDLDVFVANWGENSLYLSDEGTFEDAAGPSGLGGDGRSWNGLFADFDGDGRQDLFVGQGGPGSTDTCRLYRNLGGNFEDVTDTAGVGGISWSMGAVAFDADLDGDLDLFVTRFGGPDILFINDGSGHFTDATAGSGIDTARSVGAAAGYIDGDGLPDLAVAGFDGPVSVFINRGGGRFFKLDAASSGLGTYKKNEGVALADMDGDGDLDMYVANYDGHNRLYRNNLDSDGYLKVVLDGPDAALMGARAYLYGTDGLAMDGECLGGYGFCSQSPPEILFRLPDGGPYDLRVVFAGGEAVSKAGLGPGTVTVTTP